MALRQSKVRTMKRRKRERRRIAKTTLWEMRRYFLKRNGNVRVDPLP
jgi:hypothetical protein